MSKALRAALILLAFVAVPSSASIEQAAELVAKAQRDLHQGDAIAAEVHLKQAMEQGAVREAVAAYMGEALIAQGERDRARIWLAPGQFTRVTAPRGFRVLAHLEQIEGNLPAAGAAFDRVIALTPKDAEMWVEIARLRYAGGEHRLALDAASYAYQLDPKNVRVLELRAQIVRDRQGLVPAVPAFEAALKQSPDDPSVLGEYAATLGDLGRAKEMLAVTRKLLSVDPGNARALVLQSLLAMRAGNFDLARGLMARVGDRAEGVPAVLLVHGVLDLEAGNYVLATEAFEELARSQPNNIRARMLLVRALYLSGEYRQLVLRFDDEAAGPDASPYLLTVLARAHEALGERDLAAPLLDRAAAWRDTALADERPRIALADDAGSPSNFDALVRTGDAELTASRPDAALASYRLAANIRLPAALMLRMMSAYRSAGRSGDADGLAASFLAANPTSQSALRLAAARAFAAGDWPRARLLLANLNATAAPRDLGVLTVLSLAQLRAGDAKAAEISARTAYRLQRASPVAAQLWGLSLASSGGDRRTASALIEKSQALMGDTSLLAEARSRLAR